MKTALHHRQLSAVATVLLVAAALWATGAAGPVWARPADLQVRILAEAEVFGAEITLGDIAEMDGFDLEAMAKLAEFPIAASPPPGRSTLLPESLLRSRLAGWKGPRVQLSVPAGARVFRAAQVVSGEEIARIVLERSRLEGESSGVGRGGSAELKQRVVGSIRNAVIPKGRVEWETRLQGSHLVGGGSRLYRVIARVEGKRAWQTLVRVQQKIYDKVLVARRPIRRGQLIRGSDLSRVRKNLSANRGNPYLTKMADAVGKRAKRPIGVNEALRQGMVAAPAAVPEGGRVFLEYRSRGLVLSVPGVAMVQGKVGQFIPVRNLETGKIVHGILGADERVRVN